MIVKESVLHDIMALQKCTLTNGVHFTFLEGGEYLDHETAEIL